jgi:hypothetical protein
MTDATLAPCLFSSAVTPYDGVSRVPPRVRGGANGLSLVPPRVCGGAIFIPSLEARFAPPSWRIESGFWLEFIF